MASTEYVIVSLAGAVATFMGYAMSFAATSHHSLQRATGSRFDLDSQGHVCSCPNRPFSILTVRSSRGAIVPVPGGPVLTGPC